MARGCRDGGSRRWLWSLLVVLLGWGCVGGPAASADVEGSRVAVLVVTRASATGPAREAESIVGHLLDLRWREGYTTRTLPVLTYDFDRNAEQAYCRSRLGLDGGSLPFVGIVQLSAECVPGAVTKTIPAGGDARIRAEAAFREMRALRPPQRHATLPRSELAQMIYRLFVDLSPAALGVSEGGFKDVPPRDPDAPAILFVASQGLVGGYPDGTFRPGRAVTRYELVAVLDRVMERVARARGAAWPPGSLREVRFSDVPRAASQGAAIRRVCGSGVMSGFPDGTFAGLRAATVGETHRSMNAVRARFAIGRNQRDARVSEALGSMDGPGSACEEPAEGRGRMDVLFPTVCDGVAPVGGRR